MTGQKVREGDRVRSLDAEWTTINGKMIDIPAGSLATVDQVLAGGWGVFVLFDLAPNEEHAVYLHRSEYEWVGRPVPLTSVQRRCDAECDHS